MCDARLPCQANEIRTHVTCWTHTQNSEGSNWPIAEASSQPWSLRFASEGVKATSEQVLCWTAVFLAPGYLCRASYLRLCSRSSRNARLSSLRRFSRPCFRLALPCRAWAILTPAPQPCLPGPCRSSLTTSRPQLRPTTDLRRATPTASCARRFVPLLRLVTLSFPIRILFQLLYAPE